MSHNVEHTTQVECLKWFRLQYPKLKPLLFTVPNGSLVKGREHMPALIKYYVSEGVVAGVSDLIFLYPAHGYHALCIEFKTSTGRQSQEQKDFQNAVESVGFKYVIIRNFTQFFDLMNFWIRI